MKIGRKEAILAFIAALIPFAGRRAHAQVARVPTGPIVTPRTQLPQASPEVTDLQRRVAALEAQLTTMVGFIKDAQGNLSLRGSRDITIEAALNLKVKASGSADLLSSTTTTIRGATIALN